MTNSYRPALNSNLVSFVSRLCYSALVHCLVRLFGTVLVLLGSFWIGLLEGILGFFVGSFFCNWEGSSRIVVFGCLFRIVYQKVYLCRLFFLCFCRRFRIVRRMSSCCRRLVDV
jgi:hypothetical protein